MKTDLAIKFCRLFIIAAVLKILLLEKVLAIPLPVPAGGFLTIDPVAFEENDDIAGGQVRRSNKRLASYEDTILGMEEEDDEIYTRKLRNKRTGES